MSFMRKSARGALVAVVLAFAGAAQGGVVYDLGYDPDGFFGNGQLSVDPSCLVADGTQIAPTGNCHIDLLFDNTHDSAGGNWSRGFLANIATLFDVAGGELVSFDSIPIGLTFDSFDSSSFTSVAFTDSNPCEASGVLQFYRVHNDFSNDVTFQGCAGTDETHPYTLTRVPEPEPLALALAAGGAAWLARRRRVR